MLRLVRNGQLVANRISATRGMGALCLRLFESIAEQLQHLDSAELPALEATLSELLVASLSQPQSSSSDDTTDVQLAHLRRVCRAAAQREDSWCVGGCSMMHVGE